MDPVEKSAPTPSRTLRVPQNGYDETKYDYKSTLNGNVYFLSFNDIEEAVVAYAKLRDDKVPVRYHVYSLFVKFDELLDTDKLTEHVTGILKDAAKNITYVRVDASNHTGKVVVDRLDDCKMLLSFRDAGTTRLRFYRFDPKKAIKRLDTSYESRELSPRRVPRSQGERKKGDDDGFTKVEYKKSRKTGLFKNTAKYEPKNKASV
jgi:hypothetical protein